MEAQMPTSGLDTRIGVGLEPVRRFEVLSGMAGRRRVWTVEQKLAVLAEMERCGNIAAFARQHDIRTSLLYTWRRELRYAVAARQTTASQVMDRNEAMFVPVIADGAKPLSDDGTIEVELGGAVIRIGRAAKADLAVAIIQALQASTAQ